MFKGRIVGTTVAAIILYSIACLGLLGGLGYGIWWIEDRGDRHSECEQATKYALSGELDSLNSKPILYLRFPKHLRIPITASNASRVIKLFQVNTAEFAKVFWSKDGNVWGHPAGTYYNYASFIIRVPNKNAILLSTLMGSDSTVIRECDLTTGKQSQFIRYGASEFQFSPDNKLFATNSGYAQIYLLDVQTYEKIGLLDATYNEYRLQRSDGLAFNPDGSLLAFAVANFDPDSIDGHHEIEIWDMKSKKNAAILRGHTNNIYSLAFSADGSMIASLSLDNTVRVWGIPVQ